MLEIKDVGKTYAAGETATEAIAATRSRSRRVNSCAWSGRPAAGRRRCSSASRDSCAHRMGRSSSRAAGHRAAGGDGARFRSTTARSCRGPRCATTCMLPLRHKKLGKSGARCTRRGVARGRRADAVHRSLPVAALRRDAATRRHRARARLPALDPAHGRAVRIGRRADARRSRGPRPAEREEYGITILFVTHDIDESVYLSDRIVVLTHAPTEVKEIVTVDLPRPATRSRRRSFWSSRTSVRMSTG